MIASQRHVVALAFLAAAALASGCKKDEPKSTRWEDAAAAAAAEQAPSPSASVATTPTGTFNKFFPKDGEGGHKRVFAADKEGFAEAKLQKDGKDVAVLSVSDAAKLESAKAKFAGATEKLEGFPVMKVGNNQTTVLVADRYQVKVSSPTLDHEARKAILATFDLKGLSAL
jgi:hypothetical protein